MGEELDAAVHAMQPLVDAAWSRFREECWRHRLDYDQHVNRFCEVVLPDAGMEPSPGKVQALKVAFFRRRAGVNTPPPHQPMARDFTDRLGPAELEFVAQLPSTPSVYIGNHHGYTTRGGRRVVRSPLGLGG